MSTPPIEFQKIKYNGSKVLLKWTETKDDGSEHEHQVKSLDLPHPDLPTALDAFLPFVIETLELPDDYRNEMRVSGLSINREEKDGRLGLVVTCLKQLEATNAPLVVNTPHLRECLEEENGKFLPDRVLVLIERAEQAARAFLDGARAQGDLFGGAKA